jgi:hypothetical protein
VPETAVLPLHPDGPAEGKDGLLKESVTPIDRWLFADTFRALLPPDEADEWLAKSKAAKPSAKDVAEKDTAK